MSPQITERVAKLALNFGGRILVAPNETMEGRFCEKKKFLWKRTNRETKDKQNFETNFQPKFERLEIAKNPNSTRGEHEKELEKWKKILKNDNKIFGIVANIHRIMRHVYIFFFF